MAYNTLIKQDLMDLNNKYDISQYMEAIEEMFKEYMKNGDLTIIKMIINLCSKTIEAVYNNMDEYNKKILRDNITQLFFMVKESYKNIIIKEIDKL